MELIEAKQPEDIEFCKDIILELRPNLNKGKYLSQVIQMMTEEKFKLVYIPDTDNSKAAAFIGYRSQLMLRTGRIIYIDDLYTTGAHRGKGYAKALLDYVKKEAVTMGVTAIHLDSGYALNTAHRLYLNNGYVLDCNHFALQMGAVKE